MLHHFMRVLVGFLTRSNWQDRTLHWNVACFSHLTKEMLRTMKTPGVMLLLLGALSAQVPNPTQQQRALTPNDTGQPMPIFRVTVVSRTTKAIIYHHRTGSTHIDFRGTDLLPAARG